MAVGTQVIGLQPAIIVGLMAGPAVGVVAYVACTNMIMATMAMTNKTIREPFFPNITAFAAQDKEPQDPPAPQ